MKKKKDILMEDFKSTKDYWAKLSIRKLNSATNLDYTTYKSSYQLLQTKFITEEDKFAFGKLMSTLLDGLMYSILVMLDNEDVLAENFKMNIINFDTNELICNKMVLHKEFPYQTELDFIRNEAKKCIAFDQACEKWVSSLNIELQLFLKRLKAINNFWVDLAVKNLDKDEGLGCPSIEKEYSLIQSKIVTQEERTAFKKVVNSITEGTIHSILVTFDNGSAPAEKFPVDIINADTKESIKQGLAFHEEYPSELY